MATARLVGLLRRAGMPLTLISSVVTLDGAEASRVLTDWWGRAEAAMAERRALVSYLRSRLSGEDHTVYDITTRPMPERTLLTISRHVHLDETGPFFAHAFARLRSAGPGFVQGIAGVPFVVFYGEVSDDSDGPIELCRPIRGAIGAEPASDTGSGSGAGSDAGSGSVAAPVPPARSSAGWIRPTTRPTSAWP